MANGGGANTHMIGSGLGTGSSITMEFINRLINVQLNDLNAKVDDLTSKLENKNNTVEDYKVQIIDPNISCETTLEVVKALPKFYGEQTQYVGWREAAICLYKINSEQYFNALTILRNKTWERLMTPLQTMEQY